jgi:hypothetical protein
VKRLTRPISQPCIDLVVGTLFRETAHASHFAAMHREVQSDAEPRWLARVRANDLTALDLRGEAVVAEHVRALAAVLPLNLTLASLRLHGWNVDDGVALVLATALAGGAALTALELTGKVSHIGARSLATALQQNARLR